MDYITMGPGDVRVGAFSSTPHCPQYRIVLSRDLLESIKMAGEIPPSFTNFMTTPELSNSLYISPDIYHTQITEYLLNEAHLRWALFSLCIEHCPDCYSVRPFYRNESLWDHLSRALPTEMIFGLLRSIRSERLIHDDYMLDTLEIIIKWLQVSVSEWNWQPSQTKIDLCLGTWSRATERLVRSLPGWTSSTQECSPLASTLKFGIWAYHKLYN